MAIGHGPLFFAYIITIGISVFMFNQRTRKYGEASG